jgi:hypothetical protein
MRKSYLSDLNRQTAHNRILCVLQIIVRIYFTRIIESALDKPAMEEGLPYHFPCVIALSKPCMHMPDYWDIAPCSLVVTILAAVRTWDLTESCILHTQFILASLVLSYNRCLRVSTWFIFDFKWHSWWTKWYWSRFSRANHHLTVAPYSSINGLRCVAMALTKKCIIVPLVLS